MDPKFSLMINLRKTSRNYYYRFNFTSLSSEFEKRFLKWNVISFYSVGGTKTLISTKFYLCVWEKEYPWLHCLCFLFVSCSKHFIFTQMLRFFHSPIILAISTPKRWDRHSEYTKTDNAFHCSFWKHNYSARSQIFIFYWKIP